MMQAKEIIINIFMMVHWRTGASSSLMNPPDRYTKFHKKAP